MLPEIFTHALIGSDQQLPCSPQEPPPDWRGVLVAAPRQVSNDRTGPIPLCIYYMLPPPGGGEQPMADVVVTFPAGLQQRGRASLLPSYIELPMPSRNIPESERTYIASGGFFCIDLLAHTHLPLASSMLRVQLGLWDNWSNSVDIEWIP